MTETPTPVTAPAVTPSQTLTPANIAAAVTGTPPAQTTAPAVTPAVTPATTAPATDNALTQKTYEERVAELDKRDAAIDVKLQRMESLGTKIDSQGTATYAPAPVVTPEETQKNMLIKNLGGCISGLDKMI